MSKSGISQNGFPRIVQTDSDTAVLLSLPQVKIINRDHLLLLEQRETSNSLRETISDYSKLVTTKNRIIEDYEFEKSMCDSVREIDKEIIQYNGIQLQSEKNKTFLFKIERDVFFIAAVFLTGAIVIK